MTHAVAAVPEEHAVGPDVLDLLKDMANLGNHRLGGSGDDGLVLDLSFAG